MAVGSFVFLYPIVVVSILRHGCLHSISYCFYSRTSNKHALYDLRLDFITWCLLYPCSFLNQWEKRIFAKKNCKIIIDSSWQFLCVKQIYYFPPNGHCSICQHCSSVYFYNTYSNDWLSRLWQNIKRFNHLFLLIRLCVE